MKIKLKSKIKTVLEFGGILGVGRRKPRVSQI
jgi:hypothetical protein